MSIDFIDAKRLIGDAVDAFVERKRDLIRKSRGKNYQESMRLSGIMKENDMAAEIGRAILESKSKGVSMNKAEKIEQIKATIAKLQQQVDDLEKVEYYPCVTPVDEDGDIIFNGNQQVLSTSSDIWYVACNREDDSSDKFVWVPCKREDLKAGDTAYRKNFEEGFDCLRSVCKILDTVNHVYCLKNSVKVRRGDYAFWYKLVRKDTLGE